MSEDTAKYWEEHWAQYSEATRLNPAQILRRNLVFRLLNIKKTDTPTILDVGCGSGDMLMALGHQFPRAKLAGIDRSQSGLDVTARKIPQAQLKTVDLASPEPPTGDLLSGASHAVCSEVLEHVEDPVAVLRNLLPYLKPGGVLAITVPGGPKSAFDKSIGHIRHYTPALIRSQLEQAGYKVELATGAGFPIFNLYRMVVIMRGEKLRGDIGNKDGKPSLSARFVMGVFRAMMGFSFFSSPLGWQIIARARKPE